MYHLVDIYLHTDEWMTGILGFSILSKDTLTCGLRVCGLSSDK